ncbi:MAG TPA: inorganic diphosphatase [Prolixibacteraceae bacterium]|nr:inorganic diphosphatase [Prolixibacteraceae bacterium]
MNTRSFLLILILWRVFTACECQTCPPDEIPGQKDSCTFAGEKHFIDGYSPLDSVGHLQAVIEIPAGTNEKWEVNKTTGNIEWEKKNGHYRVVSYLAYPVNYGLIPQTLLPEVAGGDGDPLDVLVLGPAVDRGSVVPCKLIGVLYLTDTGEQDDKLIALMKGTPFEGIETLDELEENFPGVLSILRIWFTNYKGKGILDSKGFGNKEEALTILQTAIDAYSLKTDE